MSLPAKEHGIPPDLPRAIFRSGILGQRPDEVCIETPLAPNQLKNFFLRTFTSSQVLVDFSWSQPTQEIFYGSVLFYLSNVLSKLMSCLFLFIEFFWFLSLPFSSLFQIGIFIPREKSNLPLTI